MHERIKKHSAIAADYLLRQSEQGGLAYTGNVRAVTTTHWQPTAITSAEITRRKIYAEHILQYDSVCLRDAKLYGTTGDKVAKAAHLHERVCGAHILLPIAVIVLSCRTVTSKKRRCLCFLFCYFECA